MGITALVNSLRYRSYNSARVNKGTYRIGDGMGGGKIVACNWRTIKGEVVANQLKPVAVVTGDHDRTKSQLATFVLYPQTDTAIIEISNRYGDHRIRLVKRKGDTESTILKEEL